MSALTYEELVHEAHSKHRTATEEFLQEHTLRWMSDVLQQMVPEDCLRDPAKRGILLGCLARTVKARQTGSDAKEMLNLNSATGRRLPLEDVHTFFKVCQSLGVDSNRLFEAGELFSGSLSMARLLTAIWELASKCEECGVEVPPLVPMEDEKRALLRRLSAGTSRGKVNTHARPFGAYEANGVEAGNGPCFGVMPQSCDGNGLPPRLHADHEALAEEPVALQLNGREKVEHTINSYEGNCRSMSGSAPHSPLSPRPDLSPCTSDVDKVVESLRSSHQEFHQHLLDNGQDSVPRSMAPEDEYELYHEQSLAFDDDQLILGRYVLSSHSGSEPRYDLTIPSSLSSQRSDVGACDALMKQWSTVAVMGDFPYLGQKDSGALGSPPAVSPKANCERWQLQSCQGASKPLDTCVEVPPALEAGQCTGPEDGVAVQEQQRHRWWVGGGAVLAAAAGFLLMQDHGRGSGSVGQACVHQGGKGQEAVVSHTCSTGQHVGEQAAEAAQQQRASPSQLKTPWQCAGEVAASVFRRTSHAKPKVGWNMRADRARNPDELFPEQRMRVRPPKSK